MTIIFRKDKSLVVGNKLLINNKYELMIDPLEEILQYHRDRISLGYVASHKTFIKNYEDLKERLNGKLDSKIIVSDLNDLKDKIMSPDFKFIR